jgi:hypothetical protein
MHAPRPYLHHLIRRAILGVVLLVTPAALADISPPPPVQCARGYHNDQTVLGSGGLCVPDSPPKAKAAPSALATSSDAAAPAPRADAGPPPAASVTASASAAPAPSNPPAVEAPSAAPAASGSSTPSSSKKGGCDFAHGAPDGGSVSLFFGLLFLVRSRRTR